jgi:ABC-type transport system substrate-binding protein
MFDGKLLGDEALKKVQLRHPIPGLQALDRYTLRIRLKEPDNNFLFYMATPASGVVAREVIEAYPGQAGNHPVGTGPFMIGDWKRSDRIVLLANPYSSAVFHGRPARTRKTRPSPPRSRASACRASTASKSRSPRNSRAACWAS